MLRLLTHPVIAEAGFADGTDSSGADTPAGRSGEEFPLGARGVAWWARVEPEWMERRGEIELRWIDPTGRVVKSGLAEPIRRPYAMASLDAPLSPLGIWRVEARLEAETIDRRTFHVVPAE